MANSLAAVLGMGGSGGSACPIGGLVLIPGAPVNFNDGSAEYLLTGTLKPYSTDYASALLNASQLGVYGSNAKQYGGVTGNNFQFYAHIGGKYVAMYSNGYYSTDLVSWTMCTVGSGSLATIRPAVGNGYVVQANASAGYVHQRTTDGVTWANVGGNFASSPAFSPSSGAICFAPGVGWMALASLSGTAGELSYIANVVPTGTWTLSAGTNLGMSAVNGLAYGNGVFVAVGGASGLINKVATCSTMGGVWTDRSANSTLQLTTNTAGTDVVFSGQNFVATFAQIGLARSSDGITWTKIDIPKLLTGVYPAKMCTDGNGTVLATVQALVGSDTYGSFMWISTDHGVTWKSGQFYTGKIPGQANYVSPSFANGQFIINHAGSHQSPQLLGDLAAPDYVGLQKTSTNSDSKSYYHVRIK